MVIDLYDIIANRLESLKTDIQLNLQDKGINASGRTSASLAVVQYDGGVKLVSEAGDHAPMPTTEIGREGGRVPKDFYGIIKRWSVDKGLSFSTEAQRSTFAYFTARKIAREGTGRHYNNVDIYSTPVTNAVDDIIKMIGVTIVEQIRKNI